MKCKQDFESISTRIPQCDVPLLWYPMRVTYHRELKIKQHLDQLEIENFLPMRYEMVETATGSKRKLVPAIHNLIFVHSSQNTITDLKMRKSELEPLRYMTKRIEKGVREIIHVPDRQMEDFIKVASVQDDSVFFLDPSEYINKVGRQVKITAGPFKDIEGVIKRIKKNKSVVVQIEGVAAVAIAFVPANYLMLI